MALQTSTATTQSMDRGFVAAAILIGAAYMLIMVVLNKFVGAAAASVGGVALTAFATGVFKQFETLRFKAVEHPHVVALPSVRGYDVTAAIMSLYGVQVMTGLVGAPFLIWIVGKLDSSFSFDPVTNPLLQVMSDHRLLAGILILSLISFWLGGFLVGKTVPRLTVATIAICAWTTLLLVFVIQFAGLFLVGHASFIQAKDIVLAAVSAAPWQFALWIVNVALTAWGAYLAKGRRLLQTVESSSPLHGGPITSVPDM